MKRTLKLSKWIFAVLTICMLALHASTAATAANYSDNYAITNLRQVGSFDDGFTIMWDNKGFYRFDVWFSTTQNGTYKKLNSERTNSTFWAVTDLKPGKSYYIKIQGYDHDGVYTKTTKPLEVATYPDPDITVKQTAGTTKKITFSWTPASGATGYLVSKYSITVNGKKETRKLQGTKAVAGTKLTVSAAPGQEYYIQVVPFRTSSSKFRAICRYETNYSSLTIFAAPGKATNLAKSIYYDSDSMSFKWDYCKTDVWSSCYTWKIEIYSLKGKKLGTVSSKDPECNVKSKKIRDEITKYGFKFRVRASFVWDNCLLNGEWSDVKTVIPAAKMPKYFRYVSGTSYKFTWGKVPGATCYYIYVNRNNGQGKWTYKKVSNKQTSFVLNNIKKGQIIKVCVLPVVKVNGKDVKGLKNSGYTTTYYK